MGLALELELDATNGFNIIHGMRGTAIGSHGDADLVRNERSLTNSNK